MRVAIVGGTGKEGRGLALRWARAGHEVRIGSRDAERARARAAELTAEGRGAVAGGSNEEVAAASEVVVLSVPFSAHAATLESLKPALAGRILVDITVPLQPPRVFEVHLPPGESAALAAQRLLGDATPVVAALQHVSNVHLADPDHAIECDVLVCSDDAAARARVMELVASLGTRALDAGPLRNAIALESLTPVLIHLNRKYKTNSGIRLTGI